MLGNENLLFDELYEKTKGCGRVQFVKLLMTKERENKELKKQVEERTKMYQNAYDYSQKMEGNAIILETQQKEFIKWLEDYLNLFDNTCIDEQGDYDMLEGILNKYEEIIGDDALSEPTITQ